MTPDDRHDALQAADAEREAKAAEALRTEWENANERKADIIARAQFRRHPLPARLSRLVGALINERERYVDRHLKEWLADEAEADLHARDPHKYFGVSRHDFI